MRNWWRYKRNPGPSHGRDRALRRRNASSGCLLSGRKGFCGFYGDWQDTDVQEEDMTWMADNRYLVDPPEPGTEEVPYH